MLPFHSVSMSALSIQRAPFSEQFEGVQVHYSCWGFTWAYFSFYQKGVQVAFVLTHSEKMVFANVVHLNGLPNVLQSPLGNLLPQLTRPEQREGRKHKIPILDEFLLESSLQICLQPEQYEQCIYIMVCG